MHLQVKDRYSSVFNLSWVLLGYNGKTFKKKRPFTIMPTFI